MLAASDQRSYTPRAYGSGVSYANGPRVGAVRLFGSDEFSVRESVAGDQGENRVSEEIRVLAIVEAERDLIEVRRKMLNAELVVGTHDGSVEETPDALDRVRVHLADNPLVGGMVHRFMACVSVPDADIRPVLVGVDRLGIVGDNIAQVGLDRGAVGVRCDTQADFTAALNRTENEGLVGPSVTARMPGASLLALLATDAGLATNKRLVGLDDSAQERSRLVFHRCANAVAEIPGGLVGDAEHSLELVCADALLGLDHHVGGEEPLPERQLRVMEDRPDANRELVPAGVTVELATLDDPRDFVRVAAGTTHAVGPPELFEECVAAILATESFDQLRKGELSHG
jgi:hypothetical protein